MKCYYAHPISLYGTYQESEDVKFLERMGFDVVNPSGLGSSQMQDYLKLAKSCDVLAFRAMGDGTITSGVFLEISAFWPNVIELPANVEGRVLTREQTRDRVYKRD